ncbi:MAG: metal-sensitive transcriptional regulator [Bacteroidetes bacterium SW_11_45_7]|nr:MAG: metal-sensitive transcriptional regulator [Bacteroidetes bacterium SW_11_45_7]
MIPKDLSHDIIQRVNYIKGQLEGINKMLDDGKEPDQILNQFKAAQKGLDKAHYILLDEVYRKSLAIKIVEVADICPGNCGNEDKIQYIKKQFPNLHFNDLTERMKEVHEIAKRLEEYQSENNS